MVAESLVVFFVVVRLIILRPTFNRKLSGTALLLLSSAGGCFRAHFYTFHVHGKLCLYDKRPQNMDIGSICAVEQEIIASDISAMIITRTNSFVILILGY